MITLTFDYGDSYRPVYHGPGVFKTVALPVIGGWEGERFPKYDTTVNVPSPLSRPQPEEYTVPYYLPDLSLALPEQENITHSPDPNHYQLATRYTLKPIIGNMFVRIEHHMPAPPVWNLASSYDTQGEYDAALTKYSKAFDAWVESIITAGDLDPFTHAELLDDGGKFGSITASSPIFSAVFHGIDSFPTIVNGSDFGDTIQGGNHEDRIAGGPGNDDLIAGKGDESLSGGPGDDFFDAGQGHDTMRGGGGADQFRFNLHGNSPPSDPDVIMDFSHLQRDKIIIAGFADPALVAVTHQTFAHYRQHHHLINDIVRIAPGNLVQATDNGHTVRLEIDVHVVHGHLGPGDFDFLA
jgi:hypothetical protein